MSKPIIAEKAFEDMDNIWAYTIKTWSIEQADKYYNLIFDRIDFIGEFPMTGKDCSYIKTNLRCSVLESHLIFYQYIKEENYLEIIRILHQSADIKSVF